MVIRWAAVVVSALAFVVVPTSAGSAADTTSPTVHVLYFRAKDDPLDQTLLAAFEQGLEDVRRWYGQEVGKTVRRAILVEVVGGKTIAEYCGELTCEPVSEWVAAFHVVVGELEERGYVNRDDPHSVYLVGVRVSGVPYGERVLFAAGERELEIELRVTPPDSETRHARVGESTIRIARGCDGLRVSETHTLSNPTDRVLFVSEAARDDHLPILQHELPDAAGELTTPLGTLPLGLERDGAVLNFWGPLYPGQQQLEFGSVTARQIREEDKKTLERKVRELQERLDEAQEQNREQIEQNNEMVRELESAKKAASPSTFNYDKFIHSLQSSNSVLSRLRIIYLTFSSDLKMTSPMRRLPLE